jgi:hypothetical protein
MFAVQHKIKFLVLLLGIVNVSAYLFQLYTLVFRIDFFDELQIKLIINALLFVSCLLLFLVYLQNNKSTRELYGLYFKLQKRNIRLLKLPKPFSKKKTYIVFDFDSRYYASLQKYKKFIITETRFICQYLKIRLKPYFSKYKLSFSFISRLF